MSTRGRKGGRSKSVARPTTVRVSADLYGRVSDRSAEDLHRILRQGMEAVTDTLEHPVKVRVPPDVAATAGTLRKRGISGQESIRMALWAGLAMERSAADHQESDLEAVETLTARLEEWLQREDSDWDAAGVVDAMAQDVAAQVAHVGRQLAKTPTLEAMEALLKLQERAGDVMRKPNQLLRDRADADLKNAITAGKAVELAGKLADLYIHQIQMILALHRVPNRSQLLQEIVGPVGDRFIQLVQGT